MNLSENKFTRLTKHINIYSIVLHRFLYWQTEDKIAGQIFTNKITFSGVPEPEILSCTICGEKTRWKSCLPSLYSTHLVANGIGSSTVISRDFEIISIRHNLSGDSGIDPGGVIGKKCWEVSSFSICGTSDCTLTRIENNQASVHIQCSLSFTGNPRLPGIVSAFPLYCSNGHLTGTAEVFSALEKPGELEEKAEESEDRYRALAELSAEAGECILMAQDIDGREGVITFASDQFYRMTGYSRQEISGKSGFGIIEHKDRETVLVRHHQKIQGKPLSGLYRVNIIRKDGSLVACELTSAVTRYRGKPANLIYLRDITDRQKAERELAGSERKFKSLFENLPIAAWEMDLSSVKKQFDHIKAKGVKNLKEHLKQNPEDVLLKEFPSLCKYVSVNNAAFRLYEVDPRPGSKQLLKNLAYSKNIARRGAVKYHIEILTALFSGNDGFEGEMPFVKASGKSGRAWVKITIPPEHQGDFSRVFYTMHDITDLRRTQRKLQLHQAALEANVRMRTTQLTEEIQKHRKTEDKLRELFDREYKLNQKIKKQLSDRVRFTAILVHELKTPLTPVVSASDYLLANIDTEPATSFARQVNQGVLSMCNRIDELLDLTRGELGILKIKKAKFNIKGLLQDCHDVFLPVAAGRNLSLNVSAPDNLGLVWADGERIRQVVNNLIDNAVKYTPVGGAIAINARRKNKKILVEICNTDFSVKHGDNEDRLIYCWKKPTGIRKNFSSLGLGLVICKMLLDLHGEDFWFNKKDGTGTIFTFSLTTCTKENLEFGGRN